MRRTTCLAAIVTLVIYLVLPTAAGAAAPERGSFAGGDWAYSFGFGGVETLPFVDVAYTVIDFGIGRASVGMGIYGRIVPWFAALVSLGGGLVVQAGPVFLDGLDLYMSVGFMAEATWGGNYNGFRFIAGIEWFVLDWLAVCLEGHYVHLQEYSKLPFSDFKPAIGLMVKP